MIGLEAKFDGSAKDVNIKIEKFLQLPQKVLANVMTECPVDSGRLRQSHHIEPIDQSSWIVGTRVDYAAYVEFGTAPHVIVPNEKKALRWKSTGGSKYSFATKVNHPGTEPNPYFERAIERTIREVQP